MLPASLVHALSNDIKNFVPFDKMTNDFIKYFIEHASLTYYCPEEVIISDCQSDRFIVIKQGAVYSESLDNSEQVPDLMSSGECFPLEHLAHNTPINHLYRSKGHTFCYEIPREHFDYLNQNSAIFKDFCNAQLTNLLAESRKVLQQNYADLVQADPLESPLSKIVKHTPITCEPDTPIFEVIEIMHNKKIGSMIIVDPANIPLGIFTLKDLLRRVVIPELNTGLPISHVMTHKVLSLDSNNFAYEAVLTLTQKKVRHAVVIDPHTKKLVGVVSEKDLFSIRRASLRQISETLHKASSPEELRDGSRAINIFAQNMLTQGVSGEQIKLFITTLRDLLFENALKLALNHYPELKRIYSIQQSADSTSTCFALIGLGRHGRNELNLHCTQKVALVYSSVDESQNIEFKKFFKEFSTILLACGFSREVTICVPIEDWQSSIRGLLEIQSNNESTKNNDLTSPENEDQLEFIALNQMIEQLTDLEIFNERILVSYLLDTHLICGSSVLADQMRSWVRDYFKQNPMSLKSLANITLKDHSVDEKINNWLTKRLGGVDLTFSELTESSHQLFVHSAQIMGFFANSYQVSTVERLRFSLANLFEYSENEIKSYTESYNFLQILELRETTSMNELNSLEQRLLKESFKLGRKLKLLVEKQILSQIKE